MTDFEIYKKFHRDAEIPTSTYYVYQHRNPITDNVFYVGSARGNLYRAYDFHKHRNQLWKDEVISFGGILNIIVEIIEYFDNPYSAQRFEFKLIHHLKGVGEAYCCGEGHYSFDKKTPTLLYRLVMDSEEIDFRTKTQLYQYCFSHYGLSKNIVKIIIQRGEYNGSKSELHGLKIYQFGKERT